MSFSNDYFTIIAVIFSGALIFYLITSLVMSVKEGVENNSQIVASPTTQKPIEIAKNIESSNESLSHILAINTNKSPYEDIIIGLTNYYDNLIVNTIINAKMDDKGEYNLNSIVKYKQIQEVLTHSLTFIDTQ